MQGAGCREQGAVVREQGAEGWTLDRMHLLLVLVEPLLLIGPVLEHPVLLGQQLLQDNWGNKSGNRLYYFRVSAASQG